MSSLFLFLQVVSLRTHPNLKGSYAHKAIMDVVDMILFVLIKLISIHWHKENYIDHIIYNKEGALARIQFNRPNVLNVCNEKMLRELKSTLDSILQNNSKPSLPCLQVRQRFIDLFHWKLLDLGIDIMSYTEV